MDGSVGRPSGSRGAALLALAGAGILDLDAL